VAVAVHILDCEFSAWNKHVAAMLRGWPQSPACEPAQVASTARLLRIHLRMPRNARVKLMVHQPEVLGTPGGVLWQRFKGMQSGLGLSHDPMSLSRDLLVAML